MPKIEAWEVAETGEIFKLKSGYLSRLAGLRREKAEEREREIEHAIQMKLPDRCQEMKTGQELAQYFVDHNDEFIMHGMFMAGMHRNDWIRVRTAQKKGWEVIFPKIESIQFFRMAWSDTVSNSHSCPRNGETNWERKNARPIGYPGWQGRVSIEFSCNYILIRMPEGSKSKFRKTRNVIHTSEMFCERTGIRTGSGGIGGYEIRMFASDFPAMVAETNQHMAEQIKISVTEIAEIKKKLTWAKLSNESTVNFFRQIAASKDRIEERRSIIANGAGYG